MSLKSFEHFELAGLKLFLKSSGQYPFSLKRRFYNKLISFCSFIHIKSSKESFDVILILGSPLLEIRYRQIIEELKKINLTCKIVSFSRRDIIKLAMVGSITSVERVSSDFAIEKGFALYLKHKYSPKIIFQADDCNYVSAFLKRFSGAQLVNIAHCVSCISNHFNIFDFHYYFIFGNSSETNLKKINPSYGQTQLVKMGSLFLKKEAYEDIIHPKVNQLFSKHIIFSSQWLSADIVEDISWSREMINLLGQRNPHWKITIKCHPLEKCQNWVKEGPNIFIEMGDTNFHKLLSDIDFHITHHSAFALESSVCNVPTICIQRKSFKEECLKFRNYFQITDNICELEKLIMETNSYSHDLNGFVNLHLSHLGSEMEIFISTVNQIIDGEAVNSSSLTGTYAD